MVADFNEIGIVIVKIFNLRACLDDFSNKLMPEDALRFSFLLKRVVDELFKHLPMPNSPVSAAHSRILDFKHNR